MKLLVIVLIAMLILTFLIMVATLVTFVLLLTKIMTLILIMEAIENNEITLETKISCSENASSMGGSQIWLSETENLTVHEMLKAICIASANDCTYAMAEFLCGSEEVFVQKIRCNLF